MGMTPTVQPPTPSFLNLESPNSISILKNFSARVLPAFRKGILSFQFG